MPVMKTAYHVGNGATQMYEVDAEQAVRAHPGEWSLAPWSVDDTNTYRRAQYDADVEAATREGRPHPPASPEIVVTDAQRAELDADAKARTDAVALVKEDDDKKRLAREYDDKVAAARALLATPPVQIEPPPAGLAPGKPSGPAEIPSDWRDGNAAKRRALAIKLGAPPTVTTSEADDLIAAEVERRQHNPAT